jgi:hypothetical protein
MVAGIGLADPAQAAVTGWGDGGESTPTMQDLVPAMSSGEAYSERYGFSAKIDGGGEVLVNFTISNLGWGDGSAAVKVRVDLPDRDEYVYQKKVGRSEWSFSENKFRLKVADTQVRGKGDNTFIVEHNGDLQLRMKLTSKLPMWSPGNGEITVGDGYYYRLHAFALRSDMTGKVKPKGESWTEIKGTRSGYGDHVATNIAPFDLGTRFSRFRVYDDENDVFAMWREIELTDDYGGKSLSFLVVGYKEQIVFSDPDAKTTYARRVKDTKTGYRLPYAVQIDGKKNGDKVRVVLEATKVDRKDLLKGYGGVTRMIASQISQPWNYYFNCDYKIQMTIGGSTAKVQGEAGYVIDFVNK